MVPYFKGFLTYIPSDIFCGMIYSVSSNSLQLFSTSRVSLFLNHITNLIEQFPQVLFQCFTILMLHLRYYSCSKFTVARLIGQAIFQHK